MAITSGLFNSKNGDRVYDAIWFARYFATFIGNGVFPNPSTGLQVMADTNMDIYVRPGDGWINGYFIVNDSNYSLHLDPADGVLKRIDRIVMRLDYDSRIIDILIKKGIPASSPVAPALQRDINYHELALADITIGNGVTVINQANITDTRLNKDLCGVVHGIVDQVDTTTIFNQYQDWFNQKTGETDTMIQNWLVETEQEFNTWFNGIKDILDGDVAANLASRITSLEQDLAAHKTDLMNLAIGKKITLNVTSDFKKKIKGNTSTNPNIASYAYKSALVSPSASSEYLEFDIYTQIDSLNGDWNVRSKNESGSISQQLFSFDVIQILERKYGVEIFGGATTLAEKVAKARTIITNLTCNWWGFGSNPNGNKAYLKTWFGSWGGSQFNTTASPSKITWSSSSIASYIDANGYFHAIVYADTSNGTIASVINTDYVSLDITVSVSALVDDVNGNSTSLVPTQNAVRKGIEQTSYKTVKSGKDANGIFTTVQSYRKSDGTLAQKSVLSGGTSPKYTTRTNTYYAADGTTVEKTETFTLTYDADGICISEV